MLGIAGVLLLPAQDNSPLAPEILQLAKIKLRMISNLTRQPNYTCVETVERSRRDAPSRKARLVDTIRLEVALVDGKEMFAWPGTKKFEDVDLRDLVTTGAIGNGDFALHARAVFEGAGATFTYRGAENLGIRYDFHVPLFSSGYKIRTPKSEAVVAYHGSFWADPESLDVLRLDVIAEDIPLRLGLSEASDRVDYARMRIGEGDFLLPSTSELVMTDLDGSENRNRVRFSACRQFTGESVLTFGDAPESAPEPAAQVSEIVLPGDLSLRLTLMDDIDVRSAAVGDPVRARLENDLRYKGKLLFAKGATIAGRISRLRGHEDYFELGLELLEIEGGGLRAKLKAKLDEVMGVERVRRALYLAPNPGEGLIPVTTSRPRLMHGILMFWRT